MTAFGGIFHSLPLLIGEVHTALIVAGVVVAIELVTISVIRRRFWRPRCAPASFSRSGGTLIVAAAVGLRAHQPPREPPRLVESVPGRETHRLPPWSWPASTSSSPARAAGSAALAPPASRRGRPRRRRGPRRAARARRRRGDRRARRGRRRRPGGRDQRSSARPRSTTARSTCSSPTPASPVPAAARRRPTTSGRRPGRSTSWPTSGRPGRCCRAGSSAATATSPAPPRRPGC